MIGSFLESFDRVVVSLLIWSFKMICGFLVSQKYDHHQCFAQFSYREGKSFVAYDDQPIVTTFYAPCRMRDRCSTFQSLAVPGQHHPHFTSNLSSRAVDKKMPPAIQDVCLSVMQGLIDGGENKG